MLERSDFPNSQRVYLHKDVLDASFRARLNGITLPGLGGRPKDRRHGAVPVHRRRNLIILKQNVYVLVMR